MSKWVHIYVIRLLTTSTLHANYNKYPEYVATKFTLDKKIHIQDCKTLLLNILYFSTEYNIPPCCQLALSMALQINLIQIQLLVTVSHQTHVITNMQIRCVPIHRNRTDF